MKHSRIYPLDILFIYASPWSLLAIILLFSLGTGLVSFLGGNIRWGIFWLGLVTVLLLEISSFYLKAYYDSFETDRRKVALPRLNIFNRQSPENELPRNLFLQAALSTLTVGAFLTVLLSQQGALNLSTILFLGIAFTLAFFYAVPPLRLAYSGYGDLIQAILITNLIPALAYLFQTHDLHRLLAMLTFPLTGLFLAMIAALSLQSYAEDIRIGRKTILTMLGWQGGMNLHNIMIISTYAMIGLAALLGQPWALTWPELLTLPLGLYNIYLMLQISSGAKPRWRVLNLTALSIYGLMAYLITLALWTG
jgi:1,4-dihydroxy-2-naphthoate octaprenyltransferase